MRTTIDIPEEIMEEARALSTSHTKTDTVVEALQEFIRKKQRERLSQMAGRIDLDLDQTVSRNR
jgi:hypothetical protein